MERRNYMKNMKTIFILLSTLLLLVVIPLSTILYITNVEAHNNITEPTIHVTLPFRPEIVNLVYCESQDVFFMEVETRNHSVLQNNRNTILKVTSFDGQYNIFYLEVFVEESAYGYIISDIILHQGETSGNMVIKPSKLINAEHAEITFEQIVDSQSLATIMNIKLNSQTGSVTINGMNSIT